MKIKNGGGETGCFTGKTGRGKASSRRGVASERVEFRKTRIGEAVESKEEAASCRGATAAGVEFKKARKGKAFESRFEAFECVRSTKTGRVEASEGRSVAETFKGLRQCKVDCENWRLEFTPVFTARCRKWLCWIDLFYIGE